MAGKGAKPKFKPRCCVSRHAAPYGQKRPMLAASIPTAAASGAAAAARDRRPSRRPALLRGSKPSKPVADAASPSLTPRADPASVLPQAPLAAPRAVSPSLARVSACAHHVADLGASPAVVTSSFSLPLPSRSRSREDRARPTSRRRSARASWTRPRPSPRTSARHHRSRRSAPRRHLSPLRRRQRQRPSQPPPPPQLLLQRRAPCCQSGSC